MKKKFVSLLLLVLIFWGCKTADEPNAKYHEERNNVVDVQSKIVELSIDQLFGMFRLYVLDNYVIVVDLMPRGEKSIHLLDKNTLEYVTSTGILGKGPGEIAVHGGELGLDSEKRLFWYNDYGKKCAWKFPLDSVLSNPSFLPSESFELHSDLLVKEFQLLNDSIALGKAMKILDHNSFDMVTSKLDLRSNQVAVYGYQHPTAIRKNTYSDLALSLQNNIYVNAYRYMDLFTICNLDGSLKANVYGPKWSEEENESNKKKKNKVEYFGSVNFFKNYILMTYYGQKEFVMDKYKRPKGNAATRMMVFDKGGNYVKTLDFQESIGTFCVDEVNARLFLYFGEREHSLGYIDLKDLLPSE